MPHLSSPTRRVRPARMLAVALGALALVVGTADAGAAVDTDRTGYHDGFFYVFSGDDATVDLTLGAGGNYGVVWRNADSFLAGKGWNPGRARSVTWNGTFNPGGNAFVALTGWTRDPLVQYNVVESWGTVRPPSGGQPMGTVTTDGGTYDIYRTTRVAAPSIDGIRTFAQYWSVRQVRRAGGSISAGNHFAAWASRGMRLGTHDWQVLATQGYQGSGTADLNVSALLCC